MKKLLAFAAIGEAATGLALMVVPSVVGRLLLGAEFSARRDRSRSRRRHSIDFTRRCLLAVQSANRCNLRNANLWRDLLHHKSVSEGVEEITNKGWRELVGQCVLIVAAFLPFFGFKEIGRVMGENKLYAVFFGGHVDEPDSLKEGRSDPAKHPSS